MAGNFGAFFARLREPDGDSLLAALNFFPGAARFQCPLLTLSHCTRYRFLRGFPIFWHRLPPLFAATTRSQDQAEKAEKQHDGNREQAEFRHITAENEFSAGTITMYTK
jgi:hypothetical protein